MRGAHASTLAWVLSGLFAAGVAASLLTIPVQVTDSLIPILQAQAAPSWTAAVRSVADSAGYLRPLRIAQIQWIYDLSGGHFFLAYKSFHVALMLAAFALFTRAARVREHHQLFAFAFALTVFTGLHTFLGTVWEAYPINHFLEIVVATLAAYVLAESRGGWWADAALALVFAGAVLTLESGILVWVVAVTAWAAGARGVSRRGVALLTALLAAYLVLRFGYFSTGMPTLVERSTGFGTAKLDPVELTRRFGSHPSVLYAYNVLASIGSVLASQPRAGVVTLLAERQADGLSPGTLLNVVTSVLTTAALGIWGIRAVRAGRGQAMPAAGRLALVATAVLVANAVLSYGYTKDEIVSVAGGFYALAAYACARDWLAPGEASRAAVPAGLVALALLVAGGWAVRAGGLHYQMHQMAHDVRNEWVTVDRWLVAQGAAPSTPEGRALVARLRDDALARVTGNPWGLALQGTRIVR